MASMPANLIVLSFLRLGQLVLTAVLFIKTYRFSVLNSFDISCGNDVKKIVEFTLQYPFSWIAVDAPANCSREGNSTTYVWTGFGPTSILFSVLVLVSLLYCLGAIICYWRRPEDYENEKRIPASDLLCSLIITCLWVLTCYLAWYYYPSLKEATSPDRVTMQVSVCRQSGSWCYTQLQGDFGDVKTTLFMGLASALFWGISVWFIFMESGLVPDMNEDDEDVTYSDLDYEHMKEGHLPATFLPFSQDSKHDMYRKDFGMDSDKVAQLTPEDQAMMEVQQQQFLEYLANWQSQNHKSLGDNDYDRFAHGLTFSPAPHVSTISGKEYERDVLGTKVHSKWNLFKA